VSCVIAGPASANVISVQFSAGAVQNGPAVGGVSDVDVWNRANENPLVGGINLVDINGALTNITINYPIQGLWTNTGSPKLGFGTGYENLAGGYLVTKSSIDDHHVTLHNLFPGESFTLYVYSQRDNGDSEAIFSVNGSDPQQCTSGVPGMFVLNQNYLCFTGTVNSNGDIIIKWSDPTNGYYEADFNGFQLVTSVSSVPEPGTFFGVTFGTIVVAITSFCRKEKRGKAL